MSYYNRIDVSEGISLNKTSESKECNICHCWCFLDKGFKFRHMSAMDVMMSMNLSNMTILNIKDTDYRCIISGIKKVRP